MHRTRPQHIPFSTKKVSIASGKSGSAREEEPRTTTWFFFSRSLTSVSRSRKAVPMAKDRPWSSTGLMLMVALTLFGCESDETACMANDNIVDLQSTTSPIHDPTIIAENDTYYVFSSSPLGSFYTSTDLQSWRHAGEVFTDIPAWLAQAIPEADHIGSPDISFYEGRYLLFYQSHISNTCNAATGLATNTVLDPLHPDYLWVDHGLILRSTPFYEDIGIYCGDENSTFNAIDAQFFVDGEKKPWLVFGSTIGGIKLIPLDPLSLRPPVKAQYTTLAQRWLFLNDPIIEAPYLIKMGEYYYLFLSFNHCCLDDKTQYQIRVGRADKITGPYFDKDGWPLWLGGGTPLIQRDGAFIGTGHGEVFSAEGRDWLVHHAKLPAQNYRAHLNIRELRWNRDGWPSVCGQATD